MRKYGLFGDDMSLTFIYLLSGVNNPGENLAENWDLLFVVTTA